MNRLGFDFYKCLNIIEWSSDRDYHTSVIVLSKLEYIESNMFVKLKRYIAQNNLPGIAYLESKMLVPNDFIPKKTTESWDGFNFPIGLAKKYLFTFNSKKYYLKTIEKMRSQF